MILKRYLVSIVAIYLGRFLKNVTQDSLNVSLLKGILKLQNVELSSSAFEGFDAVLLRRGTIGSVSVKVPWSSLFSRRCEVCVQDVCIVLSVRTFKVSASSDVPIAKKMEFLNALDTPNSESTECERRGLRVFDASGSGFFYRLQRAVLNNLSVVVENVIVRIEDNSGRWKGSLASGTLTVRRLTYETADELFEPSFVAADVGNLYKVAVANEVSVSATHWSPMDTENCDLFFVKWEDIPACDVASLLCSREVYKDECIISSLNVNLRLKYGSNAPAGNTAVTSVQCAAAVTSEVVKATPKNTRGMAILFHGLCHVRDESTGDCPRPSGRPMKGNSDHCVAWWRYAIDQIVVQEVRKRKHCQFDWRSYMEWKRHSNYYYMHCLQLFGAFWMTGTALSSVARYRAEVALSLQDLLECRRQARRVIEHYRHTGVVLPRWLSTDSESIVAGEKHMASMTALLSDLGEHTTFNHNAVGEVLPRLNVSVEWPVLLLSVEGSVIAEVKALCCRAQVQHGGSRIMASVASVSVSTPFTSLPVLLVNGDQEASLRASLLLPAGLQNNSLKVCAACIHIHYEDALCAPIFCLLNECKALDIFYAQTGVAVSSTYSNNAFSKPLLLSVEGDLVCVAVDDVQAEARGLSYSALIEEAPTVQLRSFSVMAAGEPVASLEQARAILLPATPVGSILLECCPTLGSNLVGIQLVKQAFRRLGRLLFHEGEEDTTSSAEVHKREKAFPAEWAISIIDIKCPSAFLCSLELHGLAFHIDLMSGLKTDVHYLGHCVGHRKCPLAHVHLTMWVGSAVSLSPFRDSMLEEGGVAILLRACDATFHIDDELCSSLEVLYDSVTLLLFDGDDTTVYLSDDAYKVPNIATSVEFSNCALELGAGTNERNDTHLNPLPLVVVAGGDQAILMNILRYPDKRFSIRIDLGTRVNVYSHLPNELSFPKQLGLLPPCANGDFTIKVHLSPPSSADLDGFPYRRLNVDVHVSQRAVTLHLPSIQSLWSHFITQTLPLGRLCGIGTRAHFTSRTLRGCPLHPPPGDRRAYVPPNFGLDMTLRLCIQQSTFFFPYAHGHLSPPVLRSEVKRCNLHLSFRDYLVKVDATGRLGFPRVSLSTQPVCRHQTVHEPPLWFRCLYTIDSRAPYDGGAPKNTLYLSVAGVSRPSGKRAETFSSICVSLSREDVASLVALFTTFSFAGQSPVGGTDEGQPVSSISSVDGELPLFTSSISDDDQMLRWSVTICLAPFVVHLPSLGVAVLASGGLQCTLGTCVIACVIPSLNVLIHEVLGSASCNLEVPFLRRLLCEGYGVVNVHSPDKRWIGDRCVGGACMFGDGGPLLELTDMTPIDMMPVNQLLQGDANPAVIAICAPLVRSLCEAAESSPVSFSLGLGSLQLNLNEGLLVAVCRLDLVTRWARLMDHITCWQERMQVGRRKGYLPGLPCTGKSDASKKRVWRMCLQQAQCLCTWRSAWRGEQVGLSGTMQGVVCGLSTASQECFDGPRSSEVGKTMLGGIGFYVEDGGASLLLGEARGGKRRCSSLQLIEWNAHDDGNRCTDHWVRQLWLFKGMRVNTVPHSQSGQTSDMLSSIPAVEIVVSPLVVVLGPTAYIMLHELPRRVDQIRKSASCQGVLLLDDAAEGDYDNDAWDGESNLWGFSFNADMVASVSSAKLSEKQSPHLRARLSNSKNTEVRFADVLGEEELLHTNEVVSAHAGCQNHLPKSFLPLATPTSPADSCRKRFAVTISALSLEVTDKENELDNTHCRYQYRAGEIDAPDNDSERSNRSVIHNGLEALFPGGSTNSACMTHIGEVAPNCWTRNVEESVGTNNMRHSVIPVPSPAARSETSTSLCLSLQGLTCVSTESLWSVDLRSVAFTHSHHPPLVTLDDIRVCAAPPASKTEPRTTMPAIAHDCSSHRWEMRCSVQHVMMDLNTAAVPACVEALVTHPLIQLAPYYSFAEQEKYKTLAALYPHVPPHALPYGRRRLSKRVKAMQIQQVSSSTWTIDEDLVLSRERLVLFFSSTAINHIVVQLSGHSIGLHPHTARLTGAARIVIVVDQGLTVTIRGGAVCLPGFLCEETLLRKVETAGVEAALLPFIALGEGSFIRCEGTRLMFSEKTPQGTPVHATRSTPNGETNTAPFSSFAFDSYYRQREATPKHPMLPTRKASFENTEKASAIRAAGSNPEATPYSSFCLTCLLPTSVGTHQLRQSTVSQQSLPAWRHAHVSVCLVTLRVRSPHHTRQLSITTTLEAQVVFRGRAWDGCTAVAHHLTASAEFTEGGAVTATTTVLAPTSMELSVSGSQHAVTAERLQVEVTCSDILLLHAFATDLQRTHAAVKLAGCSSTEQCFREMVEGALSWREKSRVTKHPDFGDDWGRRSPALWHGSCSGSSEGCGGGTLGLGTLSLPDQSLLSHGMAVSSWVVLMPSVEVILSDYRYPLLRVVSVDVLLKHDTTPITGSSISFNGHSVSVDVYGKGRWDGLVALTGASCARTKTTARHSSHDFLSVSCEGLEVHASHLLLSKVLFVTRQITGWRENVRKQQQRQPLGPGLSPGTLGGRRSQRDSCSPAAVDHPLGDPQVVCVRGGGGVAATHRFQNTFDRTFYLLIGSVAGEGDIIPLFPFASVEISIPYRRVAGLSVYIYPAHCVDMTADGRYKVNNIGSHRDMDDAQTAVSNLHFGRAVGVVVDDMLLVLSCVGNHSSESGPEATSMDPDFLQRLEQYVTSSMEDTSPLHSSTEDDRGLVLVRIHAKRTIRNATDHMLQVQPLLLAAAHSSRRAPIAPITRAEFTCVPSGQQYPICVACSGVHLRITKRQTTYEAYLDVLSTNHPSFYFFTPLGRPVADQRPVMLYVGITKIEESQSTIFTVYPGLTILNHVGVPIKISLWQKDSRAGSQTVEDRRAMQSWLAASKTQISKERRQFNNQLTFLGEHHYLRQGDTLGILQCNFNANLVIGLSFNQCTGAHFSTEGLTEVASSLLSCAQCEPRRVMLRDADGRPFHVLLSVLSRTVVLSVGVWVMNLTEYPLLLSSSTLSHRLCSGQSANVGIIPSMGTPFLLDCQPQDLTVASARIGLDGSWSSSFSTDVGECGVVESFQSTVGIMRSCSYVVQFPNAQQGLPVVLRFTPRWIIFNHSSKRLQLHFDFPGLDKAVRRLQKKMDRIHDSRRPHERGKSVPAVKEGLAALSSVATVLIPAHGYHVCCVGPVQGNRVAIQEDLGGTLPTITSISRTEVSSRNPTEYYEGQRTGFLSIDGPGEFFFNLWSAPRAPPSSRSAFPKHLALPDTDAVVTGRIAVVVQTVQNVLTVVLRDVHGSKISIQNRLLDHVIVAQQEGNQRRNTVPPRQSRFFLWENTHDEHILRVTLAGCTDQWYRVDFRKGKFQVTRHSVCTDTNDHPIRCNVQAFSSTDKSRVTVLVTDTTMPLYAAVEPLRASTLCKLHITFLRMAWQLSDTPTRSDARVLFSLVQEQLQADFLDTGDSRSVSLRARRLQVVDELRHRVMLYRAWLDGVTGGQHSAISGRRGADTLHSVSGLAPGGSLGRMLTQLLPLGGDRRNERHLQHDVQFSCNTITYADGLTRVTDFDASITPLVLSLTDNWIAITLMEFQRFSSVSVPCRRATFYASSSSGGFRRTAPRHVRVSSELDIADTHSASSTALSQLSIFEDNSDESPIWPSHQQFIDVLARALRHQQHHGDSSTRLGSELIGSVTHGIHLRTPSEVLQQRQSDRKAAEADATAQSFMCIDHLHLSGILMFVTLTRHNPDPLRPLLGAYTMVLPSVLDRRAFHWDAFELQGHTETFLSLRAHIAHWAFQGLRRQWAKVTKLGRLLELLEGPWRPILRKAPAVLTMPRVHARRGCRNLTGAAESTTEEDEVDAGRGSR